MTGPTEKWAVNCDDARDELSRVYSAHSPSSGPSIRFYHRVALVANSSAEPW